MQWMYQTYKYTAFKCQIYSIIQLKGVAGNCSACMTAIQKVTSVYFSQLMY
jgi:hypothetical protein